MFAGESSGDIHAVVARTGELLASQRLVETEGCKNSTFNTIEFGGDGLSRLGVLTARGQLHVIDELLTQQLKHSVIPNTNTLCFTIVPSGDVVTCDSNNLLSLWSSDDGKFAVISSCPMFNDPPVKCTPLHHAGCHVLVLHSGGNLVLWNMERFVAVSVLGCTEVADFTIVDRPFDSQSSIGTIAVLHKSEISSRISIYSLPRMETIYAVRVCQGVLMFPSSVLHGSVYYLETWTENAPKQASGWQLCCLAEADPETRLRRLLAKQRFSEAMSFAEKFYLDMQLVYREHVSCLIKNLSTDSDELSVTELLKYLSQLSNVVFVVEVCLSTVLPTLARTNDLLSLARCRLSDQSATRHLSVDLRVSLDVQLLDVTRRLAAFQVKR